MSPTLDCLARHGHACIPVVGEHGLAKLLGSVGIRSLTDDEEGRRLVVGHVAVYRRHAGFALGPTRRRGDPLAGLDHSLQVFRRGAAAAADHRDPVVRDEPGVVLCQLLRGEVVMHAPFHHRWQAGVGQYRDRDAAALGEVAQVFAHLRRSGGAVEPDDVGAECLHGGEGRAYLSSHEHAPGRLDGDLDLDGDLATGQRHGPATANDGRLGLEQEVLDRLDDEQVHATALQKADGGFLVTVAAGRRRRCIWPRGTRSWSRGPRDPATQRLPAPGRPPPPLGRSGPPWWPVALVRWDNPYSAKTRRQGTETVGLPRRRSPRRRSCCEARRRRRGGCRRAPRCNLPGSGRRSLLVRGGATAGWCAGRTRRRRRRSRAPLRGRNPSPAPGYRGGAHPRGGWAERYFPRAGLTLRD